MKTMWLSTAQKGPLFRHNSHLKIYAKEAIIVQKVEMEQIAKYYAQKAIFVMKVLLNQFHVRRDC